MIEMICEWGQPRSLLNATEQARATKEIGATYAKWQMFDPDNLVSKDAKRYWAKELGGPKRQRTLYNKAGIKPSDWEQLFAECREIGVEPLATPFDLEAVKELESLDATAYKIASGDITYKPLIQKIGDTGKRVFLSTGASKLPEIRRALGWLKPCKVTLLACDLVYPCPPEDANLRFHIARLSEYGPVGYSDHTRETVTGAVATTLGATVLEKHITLDPEGSNPDDKMALSVERARVYLGLAEQARILCSTVSGDPQEAARHGARRSAYAVTALSQGHTLGADDVAWLRPCPEGAIEPTERMNGRVVVRSVAEGERITNGHLG